MTVVIGLMGLECVLAFFTATFGYLRARIAAQERELHDEEKRELELGMAADQDFSKTATS